MQFLHIQHTRAEELRRDCESLSKLANLNPRHALRCTSPRFLNPSPKTFCPIDPQLRNQILNPTPLGQTLIPVVSSPQLSVVLKELGRLAEAQVFLEHALTRAQVFPRLWLGLGALVLVRKLLCEEMPVEEIGSETCLMRCEEIPVQDLGSNNSQS